MGGYVNLFIMSFTFEYMINSDLKVYGSIWIFAALTLIGFFFFVFVIRETRGLTDLEKKSLYTPKSVMNFS